MRIEIPENCPCCSYPLTMIGEQLFCKNTGCSAQLNKKLEHFTKTLGIKGFGPKTIEKLELADIVQIFYLDLESVTEALGSQKTAEKLIAEVETAKSAPLATVLASFAIPLVGNTAATKICSVVSSIDEITTETCKQAGLGDKVTANLVSWIETELPEMRQFLPFSFKSEKTTTANADGKTVCITGKLKTYKTKAEAYKALEDAGYRIVESVTKATDYLVDEDNKGSTKRTKADSLGLKIINNLEEFLKETKV
jgi:NAD-dependent DNA ligase